MKLLLIGNYPKDKQFSMRQYEQLLKEAAEGLGWQVDVWHPEVRFGERHNTLAGYGKLLGYFDKYVLTPWIFRQRWAHLLKSGRPPDCVHIIDHSNAPYAPIFNGVPVLVTCHDLIAIRRALGEFQHATSPARVTARWQQNWIVKALKKVVWLCFSSRASKEDFIRLTDREAPADKWPVIYPCSAQKLEPLEEEVAQARISSAGIELSTPYLYHHGGGTWYKNRETVLRVFVQTRTRLPELRLVLSGAMLTPEQREILRADDAINATIDCGNVSENLLQALYSNASVFLFPSWCEGFGWPPIEAQSCECPVVASDAGSLKEVLGNSAALFSPADSDGMAEAVFALITNPTQAKELVQNGLENSARFNFARMQEEYQQWVTTASNKPIATKR